MSIELCFHWLDQIVILLVRLAGLALAIYVLTQLILKVIDTVLSLVGVISHVRYYIVYRRQFERWLEANPDVKDAVAHWNAYQRRRWWVYLFPIFKNWGKKTDEPED